METLRYGHEPYHPNKKLYMTCSQVVCQGDINQSSGPHMIVIKKEKIRLQYDRGMWYPSLWLVLGPGEVRTFRCVEGLYR